MVGWKIGNQEQLGKVREKEIEQNLNRAERLARSKQGSFRTNNAEKKGA
jgi:hypothetical protein